MNTVNIIGNLTKDPISNTTDSGEDVCKFTVAVNRGMKDENGRSIADYIPVRAKGRRAGLCREYLRKGKKVGIVGELHTYNYTTEDGQRRYGFEVAMRDVTFLYSGDPNKPEHGDVHADDGVIHNSIDLETGFQIEDDSELPF